MGSIVDGIFGGDDAAEDAADAQVKASEASIEFQKEALEQIRGDLAPFRDAGETGITPLVDLITNPQAQIDFLNNNPIFTAANDEINRVVTANQAAKGKLGSGGTLEELQKRFVANGLGILNQQQGALQNLVTIGQNAAAQTGTATQNTAAQVGSNLTDIGNADAAGIIGAQNANAALADSALALGGLILASDERVKTEKERVGTLDNGIPVYLFRYKGDATTRIGVMAQDVEKINPEAVIEHDGVKYVDHSKLRAA